MQHFRVALRIRPDETTNSRTTQLSSTGTSCISLLGDDRNTIQIKKMGVRPGASSASSSDTHQYSFDKIFDENATQEEVFDNVKDLVNESLKGFNVTIFAFGITGSGKTHTINGEHGGGNDGVVPRTVHHIFTDLRQHAAKSTVSFSAMVFLTFVELYNNVLYDLLAPTVDLNGDEHTSAGLKMHEHPV